MQRNTTAVGVAVTVALLVVGVGAVAAFSGTTGVAAQESPDEATNATDDTERTIRVTATGEAEAEPDQAVVRVAVTAEGETVGTVRDALANGSEELTAALDELGVEYETTEYDIRQPRRPRGEQQQVPAYAGTHAFEITVDDPDAAGEVVDVAAGAGAEIRGISLTLSDQRREQLRETAIENAIQDARSQAETIAGESGLNVTSPTAIDAAQRSYRPIELDRAQAEDAGGGGPPTSIAPGSVSVSYTVDVTYGAVRD
ncbi:DUF541 domain-containing protein [Halovenus sp. WSH3]|uniref:DUF541 domain-containing protein n=1 Tax=Halovenus carboxidivorans TaxID=2692199 RepID=A0A6B0TCQ4_9EURY|nr:SIMPL domain-containing protein [Halovenus carboxidivorans]MXR50979.1 DUF541 domain-containing protein [Halovenus carboxidivorans]